MPVSHRGVNDAFYLKRGTEFNSYAEAAGQARWLARTFGLEVVVTSNNAGGGWSLDGPAELWTEFHALRGRLGVRTQESEYAELDELRGLLEEAEGSDQPHFDDHVFEWETKSPVATRFGGPFFAETPSYWSDD